MPCRYDPGPEDLQREVDDLHVMSRLACARCKELEKTGSVPNWAADWWARHKQADQARKAAEKAERETKLVRDSALAKLTKRERKVLLGVD